MIRKIGQKILEQIYVTSDLHLFHKNMIGWDMPYRNIFSNTFEMHEQIINNWNSVVSENSIIYILGDVCMKNGKLANNILERLNGRKRLIVGNHDKYNDLKKYYNHFELVDFYEEIKYLYDDKFYHIVMFHYPIMQWNRKHFNSILLCGHSHGAIEHEVKEKNIIYDVGLDTELAKFYPILVDDIILKTRKVVLNF